MHHHDRRRAHDDIDGTERADRRVDDTRRRVHVDEILLHDFNAHAVQATQLVSKRGGICR